jgi:hypothetical protein
MTDIVVYMGGCCGDLIAALIDTTDCRVNPGTKTMTLPGSRQRLKKPHLFPTDREKDSWLEMIGMSYKSIPSHDLEYHARRKHRFVGITVQTPELSLWAAKRFQATLLPQTWLDICSGFSIKTVDDYAELMLHYSVMMLSKTPFVIRLEDIIAGKVLHSIRMHTCNGVEQGAESLYRQWLDMEHA